VWACGSCPKLLRRRAEWSVQVRGFAVSCEGNVTCFDFFADQLCKACASAVGHRRRLNDGFRL